MLTTGFFPFKPASWLTIEGDDAPEFLQGQFSNHLPLDHARSCTYGLWLDRRGRVQADSFVLRSDENSFQAFSYGSPAAVLVERLDAFIIADDVELADQTDTVAAISLVGEAAASVLASMVDLPPPGQVRRTEDGFLFSGRRSDSPSYEWVMAADAMAASLDRLRSAGVEELSELQMGLERIHAGIPSVPGEIGPGDLPQEGGLEVDAVSFTKGCYLGQEVMARLRATGRVRRRLVRVKVEGMPGCPAALYLEEEPVGELRTVMEPGEWEVNGVAMIKLGAGLTPGNGLALEPGGPVRVEVAAGFDREGSR